MNNKNILAAKTIFWLVSIFWHIVCAYLTYALFTHLRHKLNRSISETANELANLTIENDSKFNSLSHAECTFTRNDLKCICQPTYYGKTCEVFGDCLSNPCHYDGSCVKNTISAGHKCFCHNGTSGSSCEVNFNDCKNITCRNGGTCIDLINNFICKCAVNYYGTFCAYLENKCENSQCVSNNTVACQNQVHTYYCHCKEGFLQPFCSEKSSNVVDKRVGLHYDSILLDSSEFTFIKLFLYFDQLHILAAKRIKHIGISCYVLELRKHSNSYHNHRLHSIGQAPCMHVRNFAYSPHLNSYFLIKAKYIFQVNTKTGKMKNLWLQIKSTGDKIFRQMIKRNFQHVVRVDVLFDKVYFLACNNVPLIMYDGQNFTFAKRKEGERNIFAGGYHVPCSNIMEQICGEIRQEFKVSRKNGRAIRKKDRVTRNKNIRGSPPWVLA